MASASACTTLVWMAWMRTSWSELAAARPRAPSADRKAWPAASPKSRVATTLTMPTARSRPGVPDRLAGPSRSPSSARPRMPGARAAAAGVAGVPAPDGGAAGAPPGWPGGGGGDARGGGRASGRRGRGGGHEVPPGSRVPVAGIRVRRRGFSVGRGRRASRLPRRAVPRRSPGPRGGGAARWSARAVSRSRQAWWPMAASRALRAKRPLPKPLPRGVRPSTSRNRCDGLRLQLVVRARREVLAGSRRARRRCSPRTRWWCGTGWRDRGSRR